jgi:hypothetical protein
VDLLQVSGIDSLRARVTQADATALFQRRASGALWRVRRGPLRSVAAIHVPYHVFHVDIVDGARRQTALFGIDAVSGGLDPYCFEGDVSAIDVERVRETNRLPSRMTAGEVWPILEGRLQRLIFQTGFFRLRNPRIVGSPQPIDLHVPYWLGFYGTRGEAYLDALDAVRRRIEGARARAFFCAAIPTIDMPKSSSVDGSGIPTGSLNAAT